ncbi:MAG TPA: acyl-CoA-binding protein [Kofleriaceae bacterium]|nr:acyl-CoA-binding protein [Kofleriaceae bacterium]
MSDLAQRFADAQARIKPVTGLGNDTMLELYALYKQATVGDVTGDRPGMLDLRGRAKYDAWARRKGMAKDAAMQAYVELVARHAP